MSDFEPFARVIADGAGFASALTMPATDKDEADTVAAVVDSVRTWAAREIDSAAIDESAEIPPQVLASAAEMGLFGLTIPEEYGGAGLSMTATSRVVEEIARSDRSVATTVGLHCGLGLRGLLAFGSDALKSRFLPSLAAGRRIASFAATEPGAGSHIASVATTGKLADDGKLVVSGEKIWVTNGGFPGVVTIIARTPGLGGARRGYSVLLIEKDARGVTVGREEHKLGIRGSSTVSLAFDEVRLDPERVIGEAGRGLDLLNQILAWGRTLMAAGCLGGARTALAMATEHALEREQFGRPIAEFGQIRQKIAASRAAIYATESLVRLTTLIQDRQGADITWESSVAKVFASEALWMVADEALQIHGGSGFIEETGIARILRDGRITRIFEGANEVLRFHLASAALARRAGDESDIPRVAPLVVPELREEAARLDELAERTAASVADLRRRHGMRVFDRQILLAGLADALIARFTLLAVLLRTDGSLRAAEPRADRALVWTRYLGTTLARRAADGLARTERTEEATLAETIAGFEYEG